MINQRKGEDLGDDLFSKLLGSFQKRVKNFQDVKYKKNFVMSKGKQRTSKAKGGKEHESMSISRAKKGKTRRRTRRSADPEPEVTTRKVRGKKVQDKDTSEQEKEEEEEEEESEEPQETEEGDEGEEEDSDEKIRKSKNKGLLQCHYCGFRLRYAGNRSRHEESCKAKLRAELKEKENLLQEKEILIDELQEKYGSAKSEIRVLTKVLNMKYGEK